jgi:hypothetical protein
LEKKKKKQYKRSHHIEIPYSDKKTVWEEYTDMFTMKQKPYNEAFINRICQEGLQWAIHDPDALILEEFFLKLGIPQRTWSRWKQRWPQFDEAVIEMKTAIAIRREKGWLVRKLAPDTTRSLPLYSKKWKKLEEWRAGLRNKDNDNKQPTKIEIHMDKITKDE